MGLTNHELQEGIWDNAGNVTLVCLTSHELQEGIWAIGVKPDKDVF